MSEDLVSAKKAILELFVDLDDSEINSIEQWICSKSYKDDLKKKITFVLSEDQLIEIGDFIKTRVPLEAELESEIIEPPTVGDQADCSTINTCHVDEFLYDEDEIDELVKNGKLKKHYCLDCNSRNIKDLIYTSHSMSRHTTQCIFNFFLPSDLEGKQILDVGSRLGAVLYGAYYFSNASSIIGVEINQEFCEIQESTICEYSMDTNRIQIVCADLMAKPNIVAESNVITLNTLDFFLDKEKHKAMWYFFKKHMKKGTYLVTNRSMDETLESLDIYAEFSDWLTICKPQQLQNEIFFSVEVISSLYMYTVK